MNKAIFCFLRQKREKDERKKGEKAQEKSAGGGESRAATLFDTLFSFFVHVMALHFATVTARFFFFCLLPISLPKRPAERGEKENEVYLVE